MAATAEGALTGGMLDFADLVRAHQAMVFSIACHFLRDRAAAEELAQDVFLQLHKALPGLKSPEHVQFWLRKVTAHRCIDYARRHRPEVALDNAPEPTSQPPAGDPLLARRLRQLVATLPENMRLVTILRYQEDLDPEEIANLLGMPLNTVKTHLHRALGMLRDKVGRVLGEIRP